MATNAFGMQVPTAQQNRPTEKQVQALFRQQRQNQAQQQQAQRDRQRQQDSRTQRESNQNRASENRAREQQVQQKQALQRRKKEAVDRLEASQQNTRAAGIYVSEEVDWLNKIQNAQERERREEEMLQSIRDRGIFVYTDSEGKAAWIERAPESFTPDLSRAKRDYGRDEYDDILDLDEAIASR